VRLADRFFTAAVNVGYKPTVTDEREALLEAHLLDFDEDLYGKTIEVIFRKKIRAEMKFDGLDALKAQMNKDIDKVREMMEVPAAQ
jgi:riboflavin kinase/FMN adenylyltransferase